jgi:hypothetical protein
MGGLQCFAAGISPAPLLVASEGTIAAAAETLLLP